MKLLVGNYDNGAAVDNEKAILTSFQSRSQGTYQRVYSERNIPYGDSNRQVFDWLYSAEKHKGTLIFIHGGYWQFCDKEDFAFIAEIPLSLGFDVVLLEYTLAPMATLGNICQQVGVALDAIHQYSIRRGNKPIYLCGHSAGGHLAAYWQHHPCIHAVFPISGIFELEPLLATYINQKLQLTAEEIVRFSPVRNVPQQLKPMVLFYGADELPELIEQSRYYYSVLRENALSVGCQVIKNANHFDILDTLFAVDGALISKLNEFWRNTYAYSN